MKTLKNTLQILLTLSCFVLLFNSCKKKDHQKIELPPITMEGKNTFGFMVDNTIWLPSTRLVVFPNTSRKLCISYQKETGMLSISSYRDNLKDKSYVDNVYIYLKNIKEEKVYELNSSNVREISLYIDRNPTKAHSFIPSLNKGTLYIHKLDTINNIISGEFEIEFTEENSKKTILINKGRFDLQMDYCTSS